MLCLFLLTNNGVHVGAGQTAEGTMNFTSIEPSQAAAPTQPYQAAAGTQLSHGGAAATQHFQGAAATTQRVQGPASPIYVSQGAAATTYPSQAAATQASQAALTQASSFEEEAVNDAAYFVDDDDLRVLDQPPATTSSVDKRGKKQVVQKMTKLKMRG